MPFKSQAQRRKFYQLKEEGKMDQKTIDEWEKDTPPNIPERLPKKPKSPRKKFKSYKSKMAYQLGAQMAYNHHVNGTIY